MPATGSRRALLVAATAAISLLACLLALELALFVYLGWRHGPGNLVLVDDYASPHVFHVAPNDIARERGIVYRANNLGMRRSRDVSERPQPGVLRILSYGDSIANGWGVAEEDSYAFGVEAALNDSGDGRYEVLNMYRGASPTIASFHVRRDVERLRPHGVVLAIELLNDTADEVFVAVEGRDAYGLPQRTLHARYVVDWDGHLVTPLPAPLRLLERTKLWALGSQSFGKLRTRLAAAGPVRWNDPVFTDASGRPHYYYNMIFGRWMLSEPAIERAFDAMFDSLAGIRRFLDARDVRFLLVIVPSRHAYSDDRFHEASLALLRRAEARAQGLGLPSLSVYEALRAAGGDAVFMDFCHPTAAGHHALARALVGPLREWRRAARPG